MEGDWPKVRLGDVANLMTGYPFKSQHYIDDVDAPRLIGGDNIAQGNLRWDSVRRWPRDMTDGLDDYWLEPGDVVLAMDRPWIEAGLKRAAVGPHDVPSLLIQRTSRLRGTDELDTAFLRYVVGSQSFTQYILNVQTGTAVPHISPAQIRAYSFRLPPKPEQRAIAHILGTLDDKIELNRRRNQTLEAMARALFKDWFVDFGPVRAKMEGRAPYLPADLWQLFPDRLDDEGKPEGWEIQQLSELLTIIGGGTPKTSVEEYWGGDIPWFSVVDTPSASDVFVVTTEKTITDQGLADSSARLIPKGTTIISARGTVGNLAIAGRDMTFNQSCYALRGTGDAGDYFVYLATQQMVDQLKSMAHGSVFSTITRQTFEAIQRPVPPQAVLTEFEGLVTGCFDAILSSVEQSQTLAQLRDTLLPKLISGELRIADAEKFLERVA
ncbi:restriction endonuclease subunit S [Serpentinimonas barnesii]|uniref:restriction endonuclease subunit S n=1 Tax=Serpentinimonas barnesii TaxID=1458427 RepID=UPI000693B958|nr:restriction endonuclease subunit S [Serpentinimonas barnesii]